MSRILIRFVTYIKGGGVITFVGTRVNQAVHWVIQCFDPLTGYWWPSVGTLGRERTRTDKTMLSVNTYLAPTRQPRIRWGTLKLWGDGHIWAEDWYVNDHVTTIWTD